MCIYFIRNPFGGNAFGAGGLPPFPGGLPQGGFRQFGNAGGFFNGATPFQGGNMFPNGGGMAFPPQSFSAGPINGPFSSGYGAPFIPNNGFGEQPPFEDPNYFGSGTYRRSHSRHSSRHRSSSRNGRGRSPSNSDDERRRREPSYAGIQTPYNNTPQFAPRAGSPVLPYSNLQPFPSVPPLVPRPGSPILSYNNMQPFPNVPRAGSPVLPYNNNMSLFQNAPVIPPRAGSPALAFNNLQPYQNLPSIAPRVGSPALAGGLPLW